MSDELIKAAMRAGGKIADGLAEPMATPHSLRYATVVSVDGGKATVQMMGGVLSGLDMTVGAASAAPGDRVVVETYGTLAVVTGVIATADNGGYVRHEVISGWDVLKMGDIAVVTKNVGLDNQYFNETWGSLRSSGDMAGPAYPITFKDSPKVTLSHAYSDQGYQYSFWIAMHGDGTSSKAPTFVLVRPNQVTVGHPFVTVTAMGRWR